MFLTIPNRLSIIKINITQTMRTIHLFALLCFLLTLNISNCHKRIYYLYQTERDEDKLTIQTLKQNRQNHPVYIIDCTKLNCEKFKVNHFPALIFWNGPGTSFKSLYPANHDGLEQYFHAKDTHPLKPIRDFMERISLTGAFAVAVTVATLLYALFSFLFKDRSGLVEAQSKKNL